MTTLDGGVIIKKETAPAPPSGGSGENYKYCKVNNYTVFFNDLMGAYVSVKVELDGKDVILGSALFLAAFYGNSSLLTKGKAIFCDWSVKLTSQNTGEITTVQDEYGEKIKGLITNGDLTEITEAEYYSLD